MARSRGASREVHQAEGPDGGLHVPEFLPNAELQIGNVEGLSPTELQGISLEHLDEAEPAAATITKRAA